MTGRYKINPILLTAIAATMCSVPATASATPPRGGAGGSDGFFLPTPVTSGAHGGPRDAFLSDLPQDRPHRIDQRSGLNGNPTGSIFVPIPLPSVGGLGALGLLTVAAARRRRS